MNKKRYNPYRVASKEITKFRGITDSREAYNADDAYASDMRNVESFKLRTLSGRSGQRIESEYPSEGAVHVGGSFVSAKGACIGSGVYAESKSDVFQSRPKKYPWEDIYTPLWSEGLERVTLRCRDLDIPANTTPVAGSDDVIVESGDDWYKCFETTCTNAWSLIGELSGRTQAEDKADTVVDLIDAISECYDVTDAAGGSSPFPPGNTADPDINLPPPDWPDDYYPIQPSDELCVNELISFSSSSGDVSEVYILGYSADTITFEVDVSLRSPNSFEDNVSAGTTLGSQVSTSIAYNASGKFNCLKEGKVVITINVPAGIAIGTELNGSVYVSAMGQVWSADVNLIFCRQIVLADPSDSESYRESYGKTLTVVGSFPNMNNYVESFRDQELIGEFNRANSYRTRNHYLRRNFGCGTGSLNVNINDYEDQWRSGGILNYFSCPYVAGLPATYTGMFRVSVDINVTYSGFTFSTYNYGTGSGSYCCGWWDGDGVTEMGDRLACSGKTSDISTESVVLFTDKYDYTRYTSYRPLIFPNSMAKKQWGIAPGEVAADPYGGGIIQNHYQITKLEWLVMQ